MYSEYININEQPITKIRNVLPWFIGVSPVVFIPLISLFFLLGVSPILIYISIAIYFLLSVGLVVADVIYLKRKGQNFQKYIIVGILFPTIYIFIRNEKTGTSCIPAVVRICILTFAVYSLIFGGYFYLILNSAFSSEQDESTVYSQSAVSSETLILFREEDGDVLLDNDDILTVSAKMDIDGNYLIEFNFTNLGSEKFAKATEENTGKTISIYADFILIAQPTVNYKITSGNCTINGFEDMEELLETYELFVD